MKIKTIKNITDKLRKHTKYDPPQPKNKDLPPTFNILLSCSPKGGGKTYNVVQLLTNYENSGFISQEGYDVRMRTIWVSGGTANSKQNSILDTLTSLNKEDRIDMEDDVDEQMKILYEDLKQERDDIEAYNVYRRVYDKYMKSRTLTNLTLEELTLLKFKDFISPNEDPECPRDLDGNIMYHPRMVFLVLDDMIGSDGYGNNRKNFLNRLAIKSRHESDELVGLNLIFIAQSFKAIPPVIRKQTDIFVLLKSASRNYIIDAIAEEVGSHFARDEIEQYYDEVMKVPYGSLIINIHKKEQDTHRVRMGWNNIIERESKYLTN